MNLRFNLEQYGELQRKGLVSFTSDGIIVTLTQKQFSVTTGEPLPDIVMQIAVSDIQDKIAGLQSQIDNLTAMLTDTNTVVAQAIQAKGVSQPS